MGDLFDEIAEMFRRDNDVFLKYNSKIIECLDECSYEKNYIMSDGQTKYFLNEASMDYYNARNLQKYYHRDLKDLDINIAKFLHINSQNDKFGKNKVYSVFTFIEGESLDKYLPNVDEEESYSLGLKLGKILKDLQKAEIDYSTHHVGPWKQSYIYTYKGIVNKYVSNPLTDKVFEFYKNNFDVISHMDKSALSKFLNGKLTLNSIVVKDKELGLRNMSAITIGDPNYEFLFISQIALTSPAFASALLNGYFDNQIPDNFFPILKFYTSELLLSKYYELSNDEIIKIIDSYDDYSLVIPKWYKKSL